MTTGGYGGYRRPVPVSDEVRLDLNEAPRAPREAFRRVLLDRLADASWNRYPAIDAGETRASAALLYGWHAAGTLVGNGSNELLAAAVRAMVPSGGSIVALEPSFSMYAVLARRAGAVLRSIELVPPGFELDADALLAAVDGADLVVLASPNNPTGGEIDAEVLAAVAERGVPVIWDAAYLEFSQADAIPLLQRLPNLIVLRSLSKAWALAGLRVGALLASTEMAERVSGQLLPFDTGWLVDAAFRAALACPDEGAALVAEIAGERERLLDAVSRIEGWQAVPSRGNFFLLRRIGWDGDRLLDELLRRGIAVRDVPALTGEGYVRVTVGTARQGDRLIDALKEV